MDKIYQVRGILTTEYDNDCKFDDLSTVHAEFATQEEAEEFCKYITDFYFERCKVFCEFEIAEIDLTQLDTVDKLKQKFEHEYEICYNPEN